MIRKLIQLFSDRFCYVIADATDNSMTFSSRLFKRMGVMRLEKAKVMCFFEPKSGCYAYILNPETGKETQLADISYNSKYKCIGFECLVPTVNRIFYEYGIPSGCRCKLSVRKMKAGKLEYYQICRPWKKSL